MSVRWNIRIGKCFHQLNALVYLCALSSLPAQTTSSSPGHLQSQPLTRHSQASHPTVFEKHSAEATSVHFVHPFNTDHPKSYLYYESYTTGGIAIGDINQDQKPDLFFAGAPVSNALFEQVDPFHFTNTTAKRLPPHPNQWATGSTMVDIDQDGDLDIYVCNYDSPNLLFINEGPDQPMSEQAASFKINIVDACLMPSFADYDHDGDLDLFLLTNRYVKPGGRPPRPPIGIQNGKPFILPAYEKFYYLRQTGPSSYTAEATGRPDRLFRNNGDGTYSEVSSESGIGAPGHGLSATWWDFNSDGWVDLYVANDYTDPDHLYRNNGDGTFTDVIAEVMPYTSWSSMGANCGDLNNDGRMDFMVADMAATTHFKRQIAMGEMGDRLWFLENAWPRQVSRNTLFINTPAGRFLETSFLAGLAATDWTWAIQLADYDNDGRLDVFTTNGTSRMFTDADHPITLAMMIGKTEEDLWKEEPFFKEPNLAFKNLGDMRFEEIGAQWGLNHVGMSYAAAHGDLDGDGDLDLVTADLDEPIAIYENHSTGHRVIIQLKGTSGNTHGVGAMIELSAAQSGTQVRWVHPVRGYMSSNEPITHFGLGDDTTIDRLVVTWPNGARQVFTHLPGNRRYVITEAEGTDEALPSPNQELPLWAERSDDLGLVFKHEEAGFDDRQRQPLLPAMHSRLGGGMAWGDANGDGLEDLYLAGAAGQAGALFLQTGQGSFTKDTSNQVVFNSHRRHEDMAALWLDSEGDGDLDLLVTSGGVECNPNDPILHDRLYLNNGQGRLTVAPKGMLPPLATSSSCAVATDFDQDGDLDVFIGGRVIPGRYPETPSSRLLRNDQGQWVDVTEEVAPGLRKVGMVTSALWSDLNGDGLIDLMVALEYGAIQLFKQQGQRLVHQTKVSGLSGHHGWWNALQGADVDQDGDIDILAMNAGLNTKYGEPTTTSPISLFYGAMDATRRPRLIEAYWEAGTLFPIRGRATVGSIMPWVDQKFPTYRDYARASLQDIYPQEMLNQAQRLEANQLASGLWINRGDGTFDWKAFPRMAQTSPGYGVMVSDVDGNGRMDFFASQNQYSREPATGLWRGGIGCMGHFDDNSQLNLHTSQKTGWMVPGDGKGLTLCDANLDGWPDLAVAQNNDRLLLFENQAEGDHQPLCIALKGTQGNPHGVGAQLSILQKGRKGALHEIYAGSGYLSQSTPRIYVQRPENGFAVEVRWPDGSRSEHAFSKATENLITLAHPGLNLQP